MSRNKVHETSEGSGVYVGGYVADKDPVSNLEAYSFYHVEDVDNLIAIKDKRIDDLEQQLAEVNATNVGFQSQVDFAEKAVAKMQGELAEAEVKEKKSI